MWPNSRLSSHYTGLMPTREAPQGANTPRPLRIVVAACSDPPTPAALAEIPSLAHAAVRSGLVLDLRPLATLLGIPHQQLANAPVTVPAAERYPPQQRADIVNRAIMDPGIAGIIDISGGDLANEVLPYIDFAGARTYPTLVAGYSDNSCLLGALPTRSLLWNPRTGTTRGFDVVRRALSGARIRPHITPWNTAAVVCDSSTITQAPWYGGNLRCFLKLAGTPWFPDLTHAVLLIEALGTTMNALAAFLAQHRALETFGGGSQYGADTGVLGVVVGQLTAIDKAGMRQHALALIDEYVGVLPLFEAPSIGHSRDSDAATLG